MLRCTAVATFRPRDLFPALRQLASDTHLYVISRAPRVTIPARSVRPERRPWKKSGLRGVAIVWGPDPIKIPFRLPTDGRSFRWLTNEAEDWSKVLDDNGELLLQGDARLVAQIATGGDPRLQNHEVLYVGQSQGKVRVSNALDRLDGHEKAQEIVQNEQDAFHDVYWTLLDVESSHLGLFGVAASVPTPAENVAELVAQAFGTEPDRQARAINLAEAALIRYFDPRYNRQHRTNFPAKVTEASSSLHRAGHSSVVLSLSTAGHGVKFHSQRVAPAAFHYEAFSVGQRGAVLDAATQELEAHVRAQLDRESQLAAGEPLVCMMLPC